MGIVNHDNSFMKKGAIENLMSSVSHYVDRRYGYLRQNYGRL